MLCNLSKHNTTYTIQIQTLSDNHMAQGTERERVSSVHGKIEALPAG